MDSITQNTKNTKRYLPHDLKTKENAVKTYLNNGDIEYTCRKYHISRISLWRWVKKYDGTRKSFGLFPIPVHDLSNVEIT